jgi:glycosyltransferase involved in cell wall biosynthesis
MAAKIIFVNNNMLNETFFKYKSSCIYNWLSPIHKKIKHPKVLKKTINILSVGSISFSKGTDLLMDLYSLILQDKRARDYTITLNVVGSGENSFFNSIINKSYQKSLHDVNFLGYQSNVLSYYEEADIFILLSRTETFGLVYVEAMNYGLPIFALKIDVLEEIVPDWNFKSNNLNDLKDKFFELINSGNLYHEISKKNIEYSSDNFSYEKSMEETYKLYRELL